GSAIRDDDPDQNVFDVGLGIFHLHVEVAVLVENAGIEQFELRIEPAATRVPFPQRRIRKGGLRVLVEELHVAVRGRVVDVEVVLLDVLAVVAFFVREAEEALLQNRIVSVPERETKADGLMAIAESGEAVLVPAVGARARVIVRKVAPGIAVLAVILADGSPGALGEIRTPALPV